MVDSKRTDIATNRRARRDYEIIDTFEAGYEAEQHVDISRTYAARAPLLSACCCSAPRSRSVSRWSRGAGSTRRTGFSQPLRFGAPGC